ncbi:MAG: 6,7-dimethyl-8-ribityllumazine synthase [Planctomycetota bacterium]|jgi:6,7-dimethyl-8-ribityllumazine synthase
MPEIRGASDGRPLRVAVAVSRYNETVTRGLTEGALGALRECGVADEDVTVVHVPGALELPVTLSVLAQTGRYDALVALGAVIRGETDHYRIVCDETTRGCGQVAIDSGLALGFGVLTCETLALARARSGPTAKNKGAEAARSAVETAYLLHAVREHARGMLPTPEQDLADRRARDVAQAAGTRSAGPTAARSKGVGT